MKIGYPCINLTINCKGNKTFRLKSYSEERLIQTVENNLSCLKRILKFNIKKNILFFRITSDLIPFASHPINTFNWQNHFQKDFLEIGEIIKDNNIRISMHPDQFIVLNSIREDVVERSIAELTYHCEILDLMNLDVSSKVQLHIGGAYGNKLNAIERFINIFENLNNKIKRRLVIENDDKIYSIKDCLFLSKFTNIPILFDVFHHSVFNNNEKVIDCIKKTGKTWTKNDGIPMVDYSCQEPKMRPGKHAEKIDLNDFKKLIDSTKPYDYDVMLEIKNKEISALKAIKIIENDSRFIKSATEIDQKKPIN